MSSQNPNRKGEDHECEQVAWDADDERRQHDQMAPPMDPCECFCLHCRRTFMSDKIWLQKVKGSQDGFEGFWKCPTPNCGGAGFTFDIFPTDPDHPANEGWFHDDDDDEEPFEELYDDGDDEDEDDEFFEFGMENGEEENDYDPEEPRYKMMDQWAADDDDFEGEEWKHGLQPGERPTRDSDWEKPAWVIEEEKRFDQPDERPREVDWSDRPMEDDIPF